MANSTVLEARNLTKRYGSLLAVDNLNLQIRKGEVFGFLGPNGAGKSTSINMMVGITRPTSGEILLDGQRIESVAKGRIGICPQDIVVWPDLTCQENLVLMGNMYEVPKTTLKDHIYDLLNRLALAEKAKARASQLSGGMQRRLNVAMALIHDPEIAVLDEPSAGLDPQSRLMLWDFISGLRDNEGKTVILTTHLMEEADTLSNRVAIIDHGKLLHLDSPENLKKQTGEGDVLELQLADPSMNASIVDRVKTLTELSEVKEVRGRIVVRSLNAVGKLPEIITLVGQSGASIADISIRGNTLEDVFIYLTGRGLRE
jgi:ABC-2 type transport system ATP-binding protein